MASDFPTNHCLQEAEADDEEVKDQGSLASCACKGLFFEDGRTDYTHDDQAGDDENGGYDGD